MDAVPVEPLNRRAPRAVAGPILVLLAAMTALIGAGAAPPADPDVPPEELKRLIHLVRLIQREHVTIVDEARLARGCIDAVFAEPTLADKRPRQPVSDLTQVPVALRAALTTAGEAAAGRLVVTCSTGMVESLGTRSVFLTADATRAMEVPAAAIGVELAIREGRVIIVSVLEGAPAERAGVKADDRLTAINDQSVNGLELEEVARRLRGRSGSTVRLALMRGTTPLSLTAERVYLRVLTVRARRLAPGYVHVRASRLNESTAPDIERAIIPLLEEKTPALRGLLLDLRDNTGGLLQATTAVAGVFLPEGTLVGTTDGRTPKARSRFTVLPRRSESETAAVALRATPLVVLVNGGTASGGEIVAAALRAHGRAKLVGAPSSGNGHIQTIFSLDRGASLRLTTGTWLTPKGEPIDGHPLGPDVTFRTGRGFSASAPDSARDVEVEQALEVLKRP
jgi:carboxyl-terminal processing protease